MAISSPGLGSNLDVTGIITKLMQVEAQPLSALATKEASFQAKLTAYGGIKGAVSSFQSAVKALNDPSKFQGLKASSSDATVVAASATSSAVTGSYELNVTKLAQSQKLVVAGQSSTTAAIGTGATTTLTFDFGTISGGALTAYDPNTGSGGTYAGATFTSNGNGAKTVTIDSTNNTLSGMRDAINAANIGVTASIVNDGGSSPYRLVLSSSEAGKSNSIKVTATGDAAVGALLGHDPAGTQNLQQTITGQNTELTVNGVFVSKSSTSLTDVVQGVTLNIAKTGTSTVTVTKDGSAATSSVNEFVKAYNELNKTLKELSAYDATAKKGAILQGDSAVRSIQTQVRSLLSSALSNSGAYNNLSQVGISFQSDGSLKVDSTKLSTAMSTNPQGVAALFTATGSTTDSLVKYVSATSNTKTGTYAVNLTQVATQGKVTAGSAIGSLTITAGVNDTLSFSVDGVTASVNLTAQTYASNAALAAEIQSKINGAYAISSASKKVAVTETAGVLTITSALYGSTSAVSVSGNSSGNLFGTPVSTAGVNVAGTVGGISATGEGQNLTSAGDANGLKLLVSGGAAGLRGNVTYSQGFAYKLDKLIDSFMDKGGVIASKTDGIDRSLKDINTRREALNRRLTEVEARYRRQFTALDTLIGNLNQTSNYLSQQLANLPKSS